MKTKLWRASGLLVAVFLVTALAVADEDGRSVYVLTSTNDPTTNSVVVFKLNTEGPPSLTWEDTLPTGGKGGASTNAGILQFNDNFGALANWGSNTVTQLVRDDDVISIGRTISLGPGCVNPDSVALGKDHLYVVDTVCAESYPWPSGSTADGAVKPLGDATAAQIAVGRSWAAVTLADPTSMMGGSVLQLWLMHDGALSGTKTSVTLLSGARLVPLGEAFWGDILGFTPAHDTDSFAIVDKAGTEYPIVGPTPAGPPSNAPCWVAKGPGSLWYTGNSPAKKISEFFSDGQGGMFYNQTTPISLPGSPTDLTVSRDGKWLAVIYTVGSDGYVAVYSIDAYGELTYVATSTYTLPNTVSGVAFSQ